MKARGIGYGAMYYGIGYGFGRPDYGAAEIELAIDGSITLWSGSSELGQGIRTVLCQMAAQELGVAYESTRIITSDTAMTPESGPVSASRSTFVQGSAVRIACQGLASNMKLLASELMGVEPENIILHQGIVIDRSETSTPMEIKKLAEQMHRRGMQTRYYGWYNNTTEDVDPDTSQGNAFHQYAWASQMAEVEVDTETGAVTVLSIVSATDAGKAINPKLVEGQIQGGAVQGMGYALMEGMQVEKGIFINSSLTTYLVPTAADVPEIIPLIVEVPDPVGPYGAKGVGEPALIPTAPAILNAIYKAIGVRIYSLPASPEVILTAMGVIPEKGRLGTQRVDLIPYPPE
jgi:CO/xanthine dehydrogenase Mo-binding subunit